MKKLMTVLGLVIVLSMLLSACAQATATQAPAQPPAETSAPVATEAPTAVPPTTRTGAWVDEVDFSAIPDCAPAIAQISAGAVDMYPVTCDKAEDLATVQSDPNLKYVTSVGGFDQLMVNVAACKDTTVLNPFTSAKMREAMNWMIDRNYIVQEIFGGLATPRYTVLDTYVPDYARYAPAIGKVIAEYGYNMEKAKTVVNEEMTAMGATLDANGKWTYQGKPVTIIGLIRTEDKRKEIGEYFANQLETLGFTVDRQLKVRSEAAPIWQGSDLDACKFTYYTAGWISTAISRDNGNMFAQYNTDRIQVIPLFGLYKPSAEYDVPLTALQNNNFNNFDERDAYFNQAIPMHMKESWHGVMTNDNTSFSPFSTKIGVASDLAAGIGGTAFWPYTLRIEGQEGGTVKIAQSAILVDAWNPISGSNWIDDSMPQRGTMDWATMFDPYTGLALPQRIESGTITAVNGLPITKNLDWVNLEFVDSITVPGECWADWDAVNQKWITVAEKFPEGLTAKTKSTVVYPASLFDTKWHDGSNLSVADFVMYMILTFDLGKPDSKAFDTEYQPVFDTLASHLKGICITSTNPLTIETYDDLYALDAENNITGWYPTANAAYGYAYGTGPWHDMVPMYLAQVDGKLATSTTDADTKQVEKTSFIAGPSLEIQKQFLDKAAADKYIPFPEVMGQYVTADEAAARYANLTAFYDAHKHLWVGSGPFYIDQVFPVEGSMVLKAFADYPDKADKWAGFSTAKVAVATVDGPATVTQGQPATFNVSITFQDAPYPLADLSGVSYLVKDANGEVNVNGAATLTADGAAVIELTADQTSSLAAGASTLSVAVASKIVALPTFVDFEFVTVAP
jgi:peptide/nickel transport system substrate-binding protein